MLTNLRNLLLDEEGATLVEYGLIVALIAGLCIAVVATLGGTIQGVFSNINTTIKAN
jgi:pilus assembly protein Flp/PilA